MYLAVDSGKTNGIAHFDDHGTLVYVDQITVQEFPTHLAELGDSIKAIFYEEYIVDPRYAHGKGRLATAGSKNEASQVIGMIRMFCLTNKIAAIPIQRHEKDKGYAWARLKKTRNHADSHWRDAVAIGFVGLVKQGIIKEGTLPTDAY